MIGGHRINKRHDIRSSDDRRGTHGSAKLDYRNLCQEIHLPWEDARGSPRDRQGGARCAVATAHDNRQTAMIDSPDLPNPSLAEIQEIMAPPKTVALNASSQNE